jgi:hypothetical protein
MCADLIRRILVLDPTNRYTIEQVLVAAQKQYDIISSIFVIILLRVLVECMSAEVRLAVRYAVAKWPFRCPLCSSSVT